MAAMHTPMVQAIDGLTKASIYGDGGGLYSQVKRSGRRCWVFRFKVGGKTRWMGLGSDPEIGLAAARVKADEQRRLLNSGSGRIDPIVVKREAAAAKAKAEAKAAAAVVLRTFRGSTFRNWIAEATNHQQEIAEAALAHTLGGKIEAAYQRSDLLEKRRKVMAIGRHSAPLGNRQLT